MTDFINTSPFILHPLILVAALLLDFAIGDPRWLPHPVRIIGGAISRIEKFFRIYFKTPFQEKFGGIFLAVIIAVPVFGIVVIIQKAFLSIAVSSYISTAPLLQYSMNIFVVIFLVYLTSTTIAVKELVNSARLVIEAVKDKDLDSARKNLGMIVGRDTKNLSEKGILKATIETLAENLSDGIIAPLFYLAIGGLPLAVTYKAINTLDSMVGYKNERYKNFGWASARLDDIANYIPARITGIIIVVVSFFVSHSLSTIHCSLFTMLRDGKKHTSPNAGIPEAAMAGALGVMLGGPSTYGDVIVEKPHIGKNIEKDYLKASENTTLIVKIASFLSIGIAAIILYIRGLP